MVFRFAPLQPGDVKRYFQASFLVGKAQEQPSLPFTPRYPIAKLLLIRGYEDAYYRLTDAQRNQIWGQLTANLEKVGGRTQSWHDCWGTSGDYEGFGIMEYPDVQALVEEIDMSDKAGLFRYLHTEVVLGTERK